MRDYEGPAFRNKKDVFKGKRNSMGSKQFIFEPAYQVDDDKKVSQRHRKYSYHKQDQHPEHQRSLNSYRVPYLAGKNLKNKSMDQQVTPSEESKDLSKPSEKFQYQPSLTKASPSLKEFSNQNLKLDLEEPKAYHKTARQKYEPSFKEIQYDDEEAEELEEPLNVEEIIDETVEKVQEAPVFEPKKLPKPYQPKELDQIDENARVLSRRLVKSKESFILFD